MPLPHLYHSTVVQLIYHGNTMLYPTR